jgi:hypothetical protein
MNIESGFYKTMCFLLLLFDITAVGGRGRGGEEASLCVAHINTNIAGAQATACYFGHDDLVKT